MLKFFSGQGVVYYIDELTASLQLAFKIQLSVENFPGIVNEIFIFGYFVFNRFSGKFGWIMFNEMESGLSCSLYSMGKWCICCLDSIWYTSSLFLFI
jgi:hypothetical protein